VLDEIVKQLGLPPEKVVWNLEKIGNTASATISIALKLTVVDARSLTTGKLMILPGFDVRCSWGARLLRRA